MNKINVGDYIRLNRSFSTTDGDFARIIAIYTDGSNRGIIEHKDGWEDSAQYDIHTEFEFDKSKKYFYISSEWGDIIPRELTESKLWKAIYGELDD